MFCRPLAQAQLSAISRDATPLLVAIRVAIEMSPKHAACLSCFPLEDCLEDDVHSGWIWQDVVKIDGSDGLPDPEVFGDDGSSTVQH